MTRQEIIDLMRREYDPAPADFRLEDSWDDGSGRIADVVLRRVEQLKAENTRLTERLGPRGLEVVMVGDTGHYVNVKIKARIEQLEAALRDIKDCYLSRSEVHDIARAALDPSSPPSATE